MITEAALVVTCCVLFVQMGLSDAIQETLHFKTKLLSCPKCLTFWTCLIVLLIRGHGALPSLAASFVTSYCALWLCLMYDALALLYNYLYEQITQTHDTDQDAGPAQEPAANEVS